MSYRITEEVVFPYGHRLQGHPGGCGRLHGHNGRAVVVLEVDALDARGFVADFDDLHAALEEVVGDTFDHRLLLQEGDPVVPHLAAAGEDYVLLPDPPTAEVIARELFSRLHARGLPIVEVQLWETPTACAVYRPTGPGA